MDGKNNTPSAAEAASESGARQQAQGNPSDEGTSTSFRAEEGPKEEAASAVGHEYDEDNDADWTLANDNAATSQKTRHTPTEDEINEIYETVSKFAERLATDQRIGGPILNALAENDAIWNRVSNALAHALRAEPIVVAVVQTDPIIIPEPREDPIIIPEPREDPQPRQEALEEIAVLLEWVDAHGPRSVAAKLQEWQDSVNKTTPQTFDSDEHIHQMNLIRDELRDALRSSRGVR
jgi:hypothetical protein